MEQDIGDLLGQGGLLGRVCVDQDLQVKAGQVDKASPLQHLEELWVQCDKLEAPIAVDKGLVVCHGAVATQGCQVELQGASAGKPVVICVLNLHQDAMNQRE